VWQFEVKRLGKVTHADISMAPLLIFVGRNNTGKSYVATVVWALSHISSLLSRDDSKERRPTWFEKFTRRSTAAEKAGHVEITSDMAADLMKYLNSELEQKGGEYLRDVFAYNGFDGTSIKLTAAPFAPSLPGFLRPSLSTRKKGRL
jgi:predicted ATPase